MDISIILCTFNRSAPLRNALESAAAQSLPESVRWEVLMVDNNSTDSTRQVAEEYCRKYPTSFRYIFELQQGKSNALNRGIREAQGQILAFLDDDVTAEPDWLQTGAQAKSTTGASLRKIDIIVTDCILRTPPWIVFSAI